MSYRFTRDTAQSILIKAPARYIPPGEGVIVELATIRMYPNGAEILVSEGILSVTADANLTLSGLEMTTLAGTIIITADAEIMLSGASMTTSAGIVEADAVGYGTIYVSNNWSGPSPSYHIINGDTDTVTTVGPDIDGLLVMKMSLDGTKLYATTTGLADFAYVDLDTETLTVLNSANNYSWFTADSTDTYFYLIDVFPGNGFYKMNAAGTIVDTESMPSQPIAVNITSDDSKVFVAMYSSANYYVYDTVAETKTSVATTYNQGRGAILSPDDSLYYIVHQNAFDPRLVAYNTTTGATVSDVALPDTMTGLAISPDGLTIAMCNYDDAAGKVWFYDTATLTQQAVVNVGSKPWIIRYSPNGEKLYAANSDSDNISVINTTTNLVVATISTPEYPFYLVIV